MVDLLLGLQWGDEGKGKIVDALTQKYDLVARFQGGPNAGHTLEFEGIKHILRTIPSGIFHPGAINIIGNGVVIDPIVFSSELDGLAPFKIDLTKRLLIYRKAHLILPTHRWLDLASETAKGQAKIGSTLKGIGPAYMDKTGRNGLRVGDLELPNWKSKYEALKAKHLDIIEAYGLDLSFDLADEEKKFFDSLDKLRTIPFIDEEYMFQAIKSGKSILAEGAQGSLLDIDFGTYPFVTSSNTTAAGACTGLGIAPNRINKIIGIFKAYTTRVGSGPFPTELFDSTGEYICKTGFEYGSITGRKRRCGWLDLVALKYAIQINGVTELAMIKSDVLTGLDTIKVCTSYMYGNQEIQHLPYSLEGHVAPIYKELKGWTENLSKISGASRFPDPFKVYINFLEERLQIPIKIVSVGPDRTQTIYR